MRQCKVDLEAVLDIIVAADDYGYDQDELMTFLAAVVRPLTDDEIDEFAAGYLTEENKAKGYGEEDASSAADTLRTFREKWREYCESLD